MNIDQNTERWEQLLPSSTLSSRDELPVSMKAFPMDDLEKDYREIITGISFRNLQNKAQVFSNIKSGIVRTRLTHSLEVSSVAKQLGRMVVDNERSDSLGGLFGEKKDNFAQRFSMTLACAGLLHDLGNPPFGHFGEASIGSWFASRFDDPNFKYKGRQISQILDAQMQEDLKKFDGNVQTLHLLLGESSFSEGRDINVSFAVLNTLVKYPAISTEADPSSEDIRLHKFACYKADEQQYLKIREAAGMSGHVRHPLTYLLEAADDISYLISDLQDSVSMDIISAETILNHMQGSIASMPAEGDDLYELQYMSAVSMIDQLRDLLSKKESEEEMRRAMDKWFRHVRNWLIFSAARSWTDNYDAIMDGSFTGELLENRWHTIVIGLIRDIMKKYVYPSKTVVTEELMGHKLIGSLLDRFIPSVLYFGDDDPIYKPGAVEKRHLWYIPEKYRNKYLKQRTGDEAFDLYLRFLMVIDYVSGMTDAELTTTGNIL